MSAARALRAPAMATQAARASAGSPLRISSASPACRRASARRGLRLHRGGQRRRRAEQRDARPGAAAAGQRHQQGQRQAQGGIGTRAGAIHRFLDVQEAAGERSAVEQSGQRGGGFQAALRIQAGDEAERGPGLAQRRLQPGQRAAVHHVTVGRVGQREGESLARVESKRHHEAMQAGVGRGWTRAPVGPRARKVEPGRGAGLRHQPVGLRRGVGQALPGASIASRRCASGRSSLAMVGAAPARGSSRFIERSRGCLPLK